MRLRSMVAAGVAVLALTAVSGCGDDGGGDEGGADDGWGYGQSAGSGGGGRLMDTETEGRPSAATTAEIETFVSGRTTCTDLHMQARDYDDEDNPEAEAAGELWGISERAICYDETRNGVTLMSVNDMKSFQTQAKKRASDGYYLLGEDFAVTGGPTTRANLRQSGLLALVCDPEVQIPSGYTKEKALVDGCTLTDFIS